MVLFWSKPPYITANTSDRLPLRSPPAQRLLQKVVCLGRKFETRVVKILQVQPGQEEKGLEEKTINDRESEDNREHLQEAQNTKMKSKDVEASGQEKQIVKMEPVRSMITTLRELVSTGVLTEQGTRSTSRAPEYL